MALKSANASRQPRTSNARARASPGATVADAMRPTKAGAGRPSRAKNAPSSSRRAGASLARKTAKQTKRGGRATGARKSTKATKPATPRKTGARKATSTKRRARKTATRRATTAGAGARGVAPAPRGTAHRTGGGRRAPAKTSASLGQIARVGASTRGETLMRATREGVRNAGKATTGRAAKTRRTSTSGRTSTTGRAARTKTKGGPVGGRSPVGRKGGSKGAKRGVPQGSKSRKRRD